MKARLRKVWEARAPRERTIVVILTACLAAALYGWLVHSGGRDRLRLQASVATLRVQAATLEQQAAEFERLRLMPAMPVAQTDLRALVHGQVDAAGLSGGLLNIEASDANRVVLVFSSLPFADWLNLLASLRAQQVRFDSGRIEALSTPGMVSVSATLQRVSAQ